MATKKKEPTKRQAGCPRHPHAGIKKVGGVVTCAFKGCGWRETWFPTRADLAREDDRAAEGEWP